MYVILIADESGKFDWFYNDPKPFYPTRQQAEEVRRKLIEQEEYLTDKNCKVQKMYHLNV